MPLFLCLSSLLLDRAGSSDSPYVVLASYPLYSRLTYHQSIASPPSLLGLGPFARHRSASAVVRLLVGLSRSAFILVYLALTNPSRLSSVAIHCPTSCLPSYFSSLTIDKPPPVIIGRGPSSHGPSTAFCSLPSRGSPTSLHATSIHRSPTDRPTAHPSPPCIYHRPPFSFPINFHFSPVGFTTSTFQLPCVLCCCVPFFGAVDIFLISFVFVAATPLPHIFLPFFVVSNCSLFTLPVLFFPFFVSSCILTHRSSAFSVLFLSGTFCPIPTLLRLALLLFVVRGIVPILSSPRCCESTVFFFRPSYYSHVFFFFSLVSLSCRTPFMLLDGTLSSSHSSP